MKKKMEGVPLLQGVATSSLGRPVYVSLVGRPGGFHAHGLVPHISGVEDVDDMPSPC